MRSLNLVLLLVIGVVLAAGNLWFAAARSLIPLSLDNRIQKTELRWEKHPGVDDVRLIWLDDGRVLQVDLPISEAPAAGVLSEGVLVQKTSWARTMRLGGKEMQLDWSADFRGLVKCMPVVLAVLAVSVLLLANSQGLTADSVSIDSPQAGHESARNI
ncbi:MAG: hypothetical protein U0795_17385 [Pirellulales bacterium]